MQTGDVADQTSLEQEDSARRFELLDAAVESLFDNREIPTVETADTESSANRSNQLEPMREP